MATNNDVTKKIISTGIRGTSDAYRENIERIIENKRKREAAERDAGSTETGDGEEGGPEGGR